MRLVGSGIQQQRLVALAKQQRDVERIGYYTGVHGVHALERGEWNQAHKDAEVALALSRQLTQSRLRSSSLWLLGTVSAREGPDSRGDP